MCFKIILFMFQQDFVYLSICSRHNKQTFSGQTKTTTTTKKWERSSSVVECLTQDRGAAGLSLTGVTALCP